MYLRLPLNKTAIICQDALGKEAIPPGNEYTQRTKAPPLIKVM